MVKTQDERGPCGLRTGKTNTYSTKPIMVTFWDKKRKHYGILLNDILNLQANYSAIAPPHSLINAMDYPAPGRVHQTEHMLLNLSFGNLLIYHNVHNTSL